MIAVIQRVQSAQVTVEGKIVGRIERGIAALVAVHADDAAEDIAWLAGKLVSLRIFPAGDKAFDQDVQAIGGGILLISNFTVAAETQSGRRPSLSAAAGPAAALPLFDGLVEAVKATSVPIATGQFGAHMLVEIANDGPVTFVLDSRPSRKLAAGGR